MSRFHPSKLLKTSVLKHGNNFTDSPNSSHGTVKSYQAPKSIGTSIVKGKIHFQRTENSSLFSLFLGLRNRNLAGNLVVEQNIFTSLAGIEFQSESPSNMFLLTNNKKSFAAI